MSRTVVLPDLLIRLEKRVVRTWGENPVARTVNNRLICSAGYTVLRSQ